MCLHTGLPFECFSVIYLHECMQCDSTHVCTVCLCLFVWLLDDPSSVSLSVLPVVIIRLSMSANSDLLLMQI